MVTILPPWSSYNLTMVHRSNECVLARHPRDSHTNTRQEQQWRIKMYVSDVSLGGWYPPVFHTKRGSQGGFPPPWVSIHKFNVWLPPPLPGRATTGWFYIYIYMNVPYICCMQGRIMMPHLAKFGKQIGCADSLWWRCRPVCLEGAAFKGGNKNPFGGDHVGWISKGFIRGEFLHIHE